jgi:hypothetical protein
LDVLGADAEFGEQSRKGLKAAYDTGALLVCDVVWAEVRAHFPSDESCLEALSVLGVRFDAISRQAADLAGSLWRARRRNRKRSRERLIPDFLVGAHARLHSDMLLTRDRGFYRQYFADLRIIDPSQ